VTVTTSVDPIEPKVQELVKALPLPVKITTAVEYARIAEDFKATNDLLKEIAEHHDPIIAAAHKTHTLAIAAKNKLYDPLLKRKNAEARLIGDFQAEQKRKAAEEEKRRRELAEREERERKERETAEARRIASEKAAAEERARNDAEAARQLAEEAFQSFDGETADALKAEAEAHEQVAEHAGMEKEEAERYANEVAAAPVVAPAVRVDPETPQIAGLSGRTTWYAEVVSKRRYVQHVLDNWQKYENTIEIVMPSLHSLARATKKEMEIEPGIAARSKNTGVTR
jgi:hypothetical protein